MKSFKTYLKNRVPKERENMQLKVFFDGSCHLCSREIAHYKKHPRAKEKLDFVNIAASDFDPGQKGPSKKDFMKAMHIQKTDGEFVKGVEAFLLLWKELEIFPILTRLANIQVFRILMEIGYWIFARLRPYLPKRKENCHDNNCSL